MTESSKKKRSISEDDLSLLLQRYTATTILAILQEVSQCAGVKIDWNTLVKSTTTGISNAREYQMLWRHLAYRDSLLENIEDGAEPLDDDSDLEFELEAVPAASPEALSEAAACVKVLIPSDSSRDSGPASRSTVEAPLTVNIPNNPIPGDKQQLSHPNLGMDVTVPVSVKKQPLPFEGKDGNGSAGSDLPAKKKRKIWSKEEDMELIAAVEKFGEGNWLNILKGVSKPGRNASQLSQRWAVIQKRHLKTNPCSGNKTSSSTRTEEMLAAQKAISLAVDMPMTRGVSAFYSGASHVANSSTISAGIQEVPTVPALQAVNQHEQASNQATPQKKGASNLTPNKPRTTTKKPAVPAMPSVSPNPAVPAMPSVTPNPLIQAAAFAAGGRIAGPSTAASLLKAAKSKHAVHIKPGGGSHSKSLSKGAKLPSVGNSLGAQAISSFRQTLTRPPLSSGPMHTMSKLGPSTRLLLTSCSTASNLSSKQKLSQSKPGTFPGTGSQDNGEQHSEVIVSAIGVDELPDDEVGAGILGTLSESRKGTLLAPGSQRNGKQKNEAPVPIIDVDELLRKEFVCGDESQQTLLQSQQESSLGTSQESGECKSNDVASAIDVDELLRAEVVGEDETQETLSESGVDTSQETGKQKSKAFVSAIHVDEMFIEEFKCGGDTQHMLSEFNQGALLSTAAQETGIRDSEIRVSVSHVAELLNEEAGVGDGTWQAMLHGSTGSLKDAKQRCEATASTFYVDDLVREEIGGGDETRLTFLESKLETLLATCSNEGSKPKSKATVPAVHVGELLTAEDKVGDVMELFDAMVRDGQLDNLNSKANERTRKEGETVKEMAERQVGTQILVRESGESWKGDDVGAQN